MFKDYYEILEIDQYSTDEAIKSAFKKQALKWHPDRNIYIDTNSRMQDINEAYLILKDYEARQRYDKEYIKFKQFNSATITEDNNNKENINYEVEDEILIKWMENAKRQAVELAIQTIREVRELSFVAGKAAVKEMIQMFVVYFIVGLIILFLVKMRQ